MKSMIAALLGATAALAAISPASAADSLASKPMASWTGFYGGFDFGYNWAQSVTVVPAGSALPAEPHPDSITLGGHITYLHQFPHPIVLGIEADASWLNGDGWDTFPISSTQGMKPKTNWDGSVRGILGYPAMKSLFYATGGWAWTSVEGCGIDTSISSTACVAGTSYSETLSGWTVGVGVATPVPVLSGAIARVEFLHSDFGTTTVTGGGFNGGLANIDVKSDKLRFGLSWPIGKP